MNDWDKQVDEIIKKYDWIGLSKMIGCGGCKNNTDVASDHTCEVCGRMLCGECGKLCEYHREEKNG